jgi:hypothetical protein
MMGQLDSREAWAQKNRDKADCLLIYCREALPDKKWPWTPPRPQTRTWLERAERAAEFRKATKTARRILIDHDGEESVLGKFGGMDHLLVVIDRHGRIAYKERKAHAPRLDEFLHSP